MSTSPATTLYDRIEAALNLGEPNSVIREIRVMLEILFKQLTRSENWSFNEYLTNINGIKNCCGGKNWNQQLKTFKLYRMKKNYTQRLEKLKKRRLDDQLQKAVLSESFNNVNINESVKYVLESMSEIDPTYTRNTYVASENIRNNLTKGLSNKGLTVEYRHQGSVETNTHIKLHSDIDILVFSEKFYSLEPPLVPSIPYEGDPINDLNELRVECFNILNSIYSQVDNSNSKSIKVYPTSPKRKVDVVPSNWFNTVDYNNTSLEKYRGVQIFNKDTKSRQKDFPFLHISNVNDKDYRVNGSFRKLVRLLKTLKADADYDINLSSFELASIVYSIPDSGLIKPKYQELLLLNEASCHLEKLINDNAYRESLISPNGKEKVFGVSTSKVVELKKMKLELDELTEDITEELGRQFKKIDQTLIYGK